MAWVRAAIVHLWAWICYLSQLFGWATMMAWLATFI